MEMNRGKEKVERRMIQFDNAGTVSSFAVVVGFPLA